jgi:adenylate cyclase class 2
MVETEVKIPFAGDPHQARTLIEGRGYTVVEPRTLESDQIFDRGDSELRNSGRLLRLRRSGGRAIVTYKGPGTSGRYKSREEIEFDVTDPSAFQLVLHRLGYVPGFRYEKFRTKFAAPESEGIITIDETPIGVFLEIEGPAQWIDSTALRLGLSPDEYCTSSYASLYKEYLRLHPDAPINMVFSNARP